MKLIRAWMCKQDKGRAHVTSARLCKDCYRVLILKQTDYRKLRAVVMAAKKLHQPMAKGL